MSNYIIENLKTQEKDIISITTGVVKATILKEETVYVKRNADVKGRRKVVYSKILQITKKMTNNEIDILDMLISSTNTRCYCMNSKNKKYLSNTDLVNHFNLSKAVVSKAITKLVKLGAIKKDGRKIVFNPYLYTPYNVSDLKLGFLQDWWDSDFKYEYENELEACEEEIMRSIRLNTPKSV
jgi:predicted transcriptional regulator